MAGGRAAPGAAARRRDAGGRPASAADERGGGGGRPIDRGAFEILAADRVKRGIGNLGSPAVQAELDPWLEGVELLILDNLSSLTVGCARTIPDAWSPIQQWLLQLRRRGISVLIIHHAGKTGGQRGTSRREDVLDTSFLLGRPSDHSATEGGASRSISRRRAASTAISSSRSRRGSSCATARRPGA